MAGTTSDSVQMTWVLRAVAAFSLAFAFAGSHRVAAQSPRVGEGWPTYGGDAGGLRFSNSDQITRNNLDRLHVAWTFHTHALDGEGARDALPSFEATPVLRRDTLYLASPFDVVFALDARTGVERWHYDPQLTGLRAGGLVTARGVALWPADRAPAANGGDCRERVFEGTLDARLLALDAATGKPCAAFGNNGRVDLREGVHFQNVGYYGMTSPPTVVGDVVVVGSTVGDNQQVDIESGLVRGYDAVSGKLLWSWEPLPWAAAQKVRTGAGNTWSVISADPAMGLVFLPTGSASPDYYGGMRPGDDRDADSVVALDAKTGRKVWAFQVVHHDIWDYDVASEPVLFTWRGPTPAIAVTTKMGMIFLLDRRTGQPLVPVEERAVPQSDVEGEKASPTQPFQAIPSLSPLQMSLGDFQAPWRSAADAEFCRRQFAGLRYEGIYTPPSLRGSVLFPGNLGGVNWGGAAIDPATGILYANSNREAFVARLVPRHSLEHIEDVTENILFNWPLWVLLFAVALADMLIRRRSASRWRGVLIVAAACAGVFGGGWIRYLIYPPPAWVVMVDHFGSELSEQRGTPYLVDRHPVLDSHGMSCTPGPWGATTAVNLNTLEKVWETPLGTRVAGQETGVRNFGGPIVTAAGLVISAGAEDNWLRVFDAVTGMELKKMALPFAAVSTPMTYTLDGKQYIVVAAGGHGDGTTPLGDSLMAFAVD